MLTSPRLTRTTESARSQRCEGVDVAMSSSQPSAGGPAGQPSGESLGDPVSPPVEVDGASRGHGDNVNAPERTVDVETGSQTRAQQVRAQAQARAAQLRGQA